MRSHLKAPFSLLAGSQSRPAGPGSPERRARYRNPRSRGVRQMRANAREAAAKTCGAERKSPRRGGISPPSVRIHPSFCRSHSDKGGIKRRRPPLVEGFFLRPVGGVKFKTASLGAFATPLAGSPLFLAPCQGGRGVVLRVRADKGGGFQSERRGRAEQNPVAHRRPRLRRNLPPSFIRGLSGSPPQGVFSFNPLREAVATSPPTHCMAFDRHSGIIAVPAAGPCSRARLRPSRAHRETGGAHQLRRSPVKEPLLSETCDSQAIIQYEV